MSGSIKDRGFEKELKISASRSSGPGGQNVNKVNSKVTIHFNVETSKLLTNSEKEKIYQRLKKLITADGEIVISNQQSRSQLQNKLAAIEQLHVVIENALKTIKKRIKTKRTKASIEKRLSNKKIQSIKKMSRRAKDF